MENSERKTSGEIFSEVSEISENSMFCTSPCAPQNVLSMHDWFGQYIDMGAWNLFLHRGGIQNNTDESALIHFNQPKHTLTDFQLIPVLHINNNRDSIRLSVEQHLIENTGTLQNSINRTCNH